MASLSVYPQNYSTNYKQRTIINNDIKLDDLLSSVSKLDDLWTISINLFTLYFLLGVKEFNFQLSWWLMCQLIAHFSVSQLIINQVKCNLILLLSASWLMMMAHHSIVQWMNQLPAAKDRLVEPGMSCMIRWQIASVTFILVHI